jgi:acetyl esterase/lipase
MAGMTYRLWSDEIEALRDEARTVITTTGSLMPRPEVTPGMTQAERIAAQRAGHQVPPEFTVPEAEAREIAGVPCRVIAPPSGAAPHAIYLHFHGGGMVAGSPEMMDIPNRQVAREHDVTVVSVNYRKAPEHPWPAGPDDGVAVARWLVEHGERELGAARILIGGESAGAYMTASVALRVRDELGAIDRVDGLNLVFGVYDWGRTPSQRGLRPHAGFDVLDPEGIAFVADCFVPGRSDDERRAPEISPLYADLAGLPPSLLSVGTCDHLFDDTMLFAGRAAAAGVDVELVVLPEMPHAFMMYGCGITKAWAATTDAWFAARLAP